MCSDLISRQDVLDAVNDCGICIQKILDIPSAELETFEFCSGGDNPCKEYDQEKHCCHRWTKVIRQTVEDIKNRWKWIPVTEALPEKHQRVLVTIKRTDGEMRVRSGNYSDDYFWIDNGDYWKCNEVLAWMPLPEPAKIGDGK